MGLNFKEMAFSAGIRSLNRLRPDSNQYLLKIAQEKFTPQRELLDEHYLYYSKVAQYVPNRSDAYGLLGFINNKRGDDSNAIKAYERAIEINPHFFWFYHNLGIIYFKNEEYTKAIETIRKGLELPYKATAVSITSSQQIYMPFVLERMENIQRDLYMEYQTGLKDAYKVIALSQCHLGQYEELLSMSSRLVGKSEDPDSYFMLMAGIAAYHLNEFSFVIPRLQNSFKNGMAHRVLFKYLGETLHQLGEDAEGDAVLNRLSKYGTIQDEELFFKGADIFLNLY